MAETYVQACFAHAGESDLDFPLKTFLIIIKLGQITQRGHFRVNMRAHRFCNKTRAWLSPCGSAGQQTSTLQQRFQAVSWVTAAHLGCGHSHPQPKSILLSAMCYLTV